MGKYSRRYEHGLSIRHKTSQLTGKNLSLQEVLWYIVMSSVCCHPVRSLDNTFSSKANILGQIIAAKE